MKSNRTNRSLILIAALCLLTLAACTGRTTHKTPPKARHGMLDLRSWDFAKNGPVRLDGEWAIYWKQYLNQIDSTQAVTDYVSTGKSWQEGSQKIPAANGYATMHLRVLISKTQANELGIKINEFSTAYEFDVNETTIASSGKIGRDESTTTPEYRPQLCLLNDTSQVLDLVVRVANFHHFKGGLLQPVLIGSYDELLSYDRTMSRYGGFLYGLLLIIGLFHLGIYLFRRKETYNLYYSIYCIFSCIANAMINERYLFTVVGPEYWEWCYKISLAIVPIFLSGLLLFYVAFFKGLIVRWLKITLLTIGAFMVLFVLVTPTTLGSYLELAIPLYLLIMSLIAIVINSIAMYRKLPASAMLFTCNLLFLAAFIYDGAFVEKQMGTITLVHLCTVAYVMVISYILSKRFASIFAKAEQLSQEVILANKKLEEQNKNLEAEVKMRTKQVVLSEKMSVLGQLTANIAHEINTPLGAIKASINTIHESFKTSTDLSLNMLKDVNPENLRLIYCIIQEALQQELSLSRKDERQVRKKIASELEEMEVKNASLIADYLVRSGFTSVKAEYAELLKQEGIEPLVSFLFEQLEQVINNRNVRTAIEKVSKIMYALKNYSRHTVGGEKVSISLESDIDSVLMLYHNWLKRGVQVTCNYGNIRPLSCFADELNQVWTNLIMNALQAMNDVGELSISTAEENGNAVVKIANNGPKIPEEQLEQIFEPFFTTKAHGEGSGLGLDIVKTIIKKHEGQISVESTDEQTVFTISIPYTS